MSLKGLRVSNGRAPYIQLTGLVSASLGTEVPLYK